MAVPETQTVAPGAGAIRLARGPLLAVAGAVVALLVATSWRYGFHRDELYFLVAGQHPDWGYPDQPPMTPILARLMDGLGGSIVVVRLPSAIAAGVTVLLAGMTAREMGGGRRAQLIAAACTAVSATTLVTGHFVSTTTYDVLFSAALTWLLARSVRTGESWLLLPAGLALGLGLLNKPLIGVLAAALLVGIALAGPRRLLRSGWLWAGGGGGRRLRRALPGVAGPQRLARAAHGRARSPAGTRRAAGSGSSRSSCCWSARCWRRCGSPAWYGCSAPGRAARSGSSASATCCSRSSTCSPAARRTTSPGCTRRCWRPARSPPTAGCATVRGRARLLAAALALSLVVGAVVGLAVLPARALGPVLAVNPDAGEQVAWPRYVDQIAAVWNRLPGSQRATGVVLTQNYGEAGAIDRYGPAVGLPPAYSGHNGFADWAQPFGQAGPVVVVGYADDSVRGRLFGACEQQATWTTGSASTPRSRACPSGSAASRPAPGPTPGKTSAT